MKGEFGLLAKRPRSTSLALLALATALSAGAAQPGNGSMPVQLMGVTPSAPAASSASLGQERPAESFDASPLVQRYGKILDRRFVGAGGLTAWTVEKNGHRVVLYTTADGRAVISGIVWDSFTGRNLSDQFIPQPPAAVLPPLGGSTGAAAAQPAGATTPKGGALVGNYKGSIPESIKTIDTLAGIKEGTGGPADTLYIIFDPRCPYCRKAYGATRAYVQKGFTIKWIPAVALGNPDQGAPLASTILQAPVPQQQDALARVLGNHDQLMAAPTKATQAALTRNLQFLFAAFQNSGQKEVGVPAAFFLDKQTGNPRMMTGISELPVIEQVFGKL